MQLGHHAQAAAPGPALEAAYIGAAARLAPAACMLMRAQPCSCAQPAAGTIGAGRLGRIQQISESQFPSFILFFLTVTLLWKMSEYSTRNSYTACVGFYNLSHVIH